MAGETQDDDQNVATASGILVPPAAMATCAQLVVLLREAYADLPMEAEPGDFLVALERLADPEEQR